MVSRVHFIIAGLCYKLLQFIRRSNKASHSELAVFANDDLGLRLSCFGEFETEILSYLRTSFGSDLVETHFIDVGANLGNHSIGLCDYFIIVMHMSPTLELFVCYRPILPTGQT